MAAVHNRGPVFDDRFRRALDVSIAGGLGVAVLPLCGLIALAVRLDSAGPAIYRQQRVGLGGRLFGMYKFRSMRDNCHQSRLKSRADLDVTRVGWFLRRSSLDELPQLWNVLRGDMALVGPRPELPSLLASYRKDDFARFDVRPGLSGLWQISGRSDLCLEEKLALDLRYIARRSLWLDLCILARTPFALVTGRGAF